ncbi:CidA/LrgA family holin-like protein [Peribacillus cavernae]|uniref:CidA/LrgA family holin-like protein n=1 Tax=Peribacillus cavernae TaxID=1674310 RepID=A0A433HRY0_9BACI|nr:CidA/LrgA family holin-like protein [Peribacillus cavernae]MDQ0218803.1 holin-like protein [Peribacillus cavernae]RUQ31012.1 CidA/LrgA family holin-like protein [Peribacillus cavernae]
MKLGIIILQIGFIHLFLFLGAAIKNFIPVPVPASMIGLLLLLIALLLKIVKLEWIEQGGNWLLAELLLFFIPSAVGIVNYDEIFSLQGAESVLLIGVSTFIVMGATAFTAEKMYNRKHRETE